MTWIADNWLPLLIGFILGVLLMWLLSKRKKKDSQTPKNDGDESPTRPKDRQPPVRPKVHAAAGAKGHQPRAKIGDTPPRTTPPPTPPTVPTPPPPATPPPPEIRPQRVRPKINTGAFDVEQERYGDGFIISPEMLTRKE